MHMLINSSKCIEHLLYTKCQWANKNTAVIQDGILTKIGLGALFPCLRFQAQDTLLH